MLGFEFMGRNGWIGFVFLALYACTPQGDPALGKTGFKDNFERDDIGELWLNTGGNYTIRQGALRTQGSRNHPLWLRRTLPQNVRIEFTARSESPDGDIKVEVFGDGVSKAESTSYTASGYVVIFGGWRNTLNVIARKDEHGSDRVVGPKQPVEMSHTYAMKIERRGQELSVFADGKELARMKDSQALTGKGQDHFGFNNWDAEIWFDNLTISPL